MAVKVLLVEDHDDTRNVIDDFLSSRGFQVQTASSKETALTVARAEKFDLIICDLGLPDGRGWEILESLQPTNTPAIAISGFGMAADLERSRKAGFIKHLIKPFDSNSLAKAVKEALPHAQV